uniref:Protein kinase domain-containing protein n=2 Tax=Bursaphelenchus xylophilus TaxID=6326 RepID=A0A1I7SH67_BURXY
MVDRGKTDTFFFMVMELVGKSLEDLMDTRPKPGNFSISTGLRAGRQMLTGLHQLHSLGFIHRDLKPANFAVGFGAKLRKIYILDFGIARSVLTEAKTMKRPRCMVGFKGTVRYAPIACHQNQDQDFKDDVESWLYSLLEIIHPRGLPWQNLCDKFTVLMYKELCRTEKKERDELFPPIKCRNVLWKMLEIIDNMEYRVPVEYDILYKLLQDCYRIHGVKEKDKYDWEPASPPRA